MKKLFRFGLISLALSLCIGSGVMAFRSAKQPVKTSADTQTVTFTKVREGFIERGDDPSGGLSTLSLSSTAFSGAKHQDTLSSGHIGVNMGESSSSKNWHAVFMEYSYTFNNAAYSQTTLSFTYSLSTYRDSSSGEADHVMEFIHEGYVNSSTNSYTLGCGKDTPATVSQPTSTMLGSPAAFRVNLRTQGTQSVGNQTLSRTLTNTSNSDASYTFNVAFFCYIESSSYAHTHIATGSLDLTISTTYYDAQYTVGGTTNYGTFVQAWNACNGNANGGQIILLRDVAVNSGFAVNNTITLNLSGHTLTRNGSGTHENRYAAIFGVSDGKTFSINNGNATTTGYISTNYSTSAITVGHGSTLTVSGGATIRNTYGVSGGGHVVVLNGGRFTLSSSALIGADSGSSTTNSCVLLRDGATFNMLGGNITGGSYAIRSDNTSSSKDTIALAGVCNIQRKIGIPSLSVCGIQFYYNSSNTFGAGSSNVSIEFGTLPTINTAFATGYGSTGTNIVSKISIANAPTWTAIQYSNPNFMYVYKQYTITYSLSHLSASNTSSGNHGSNYVTTLTPTDTKLYARPTSISLKRGSTTLTAGTHYTYNSSTGMVTIYADTFEGTSAFTLQASALLTTTGKAYEFIDGFMHMNDYTEELGWCKDSTHNYYYVAKNSFNKLEKDVRNLFAASADTKIADARARLVAWAAARGEALEISGDNGYVLQTSISLEVYEESDNSMIIIIAMAAISVAALTSFAIVLLKKRKHQAK